MAEWESLTKQDWYRRMTPGAESDWVQLTTLKIDKGDLAIADLEFIGDSQMPRVFAVPPSTYTVSAKLISLSDGDKRVSRMRAVTGKDARLGQRLDGLPVDMWRVGFYDPTVTLDDEYAEQFVGRLNAIELIGVISLTGKQVIRIPVAFSGMGAGYYPIHELISENKRVGLEVAFIGPEELAEHPDQKIVRPKKS